MSVSLSVRGVSLLIGALALAGSPDMFPWKPAATRAADHPPISAGQPYREARRLMLRAGWTFRPQQSREICRASLMDRRCELFPELGACSQTGLGLCRFEWKSPSGSGLAVITSGGTVQGDPGRITDWFPTTPPRGDQDSLR